MKEEKHAVPLTEEEVLHYEEILLYEEKIRHLEESISSLRMSRRILMSLMEQMQHTHRAEQARLQKENRHLKRQLATAARWMLKQAPAPAPQEQRSSDTP